MSFASVSPQQSDDLLVAEIETVLERHGVDGCCPVGLCITDLQHRFHDVSGCFSCPVSVIDQTENGWMPASQPVYNAVAGLVQGSVGKKRCKKYIIVIFRLPQGNTTIILLEKSAIRKSDGAND